MNEGDAFLHLLKTLGGRRMELVEEVKKLLTEAESLPLVSYFC